LWMDASFNLQVACFIVADVIGFNDL